MDNTTTAAAVTIVREAFDHARELRSRVVGQEHVLLSLTAHPDALAIEILTALGVGETLRGLPHLITPGAVEEPAPEPTPRLVKAMEEADAEAAERGRPATSADLLVGILRARVGVGYRLLASLGMSVDAARAAFDAVAVAQQHRELDEVIDGTLVRALDRA